MPTEHSPEACFLHPTSSVLLRSLCCFAQCCIWTLSSSLISLSVLFLPTSLFQRLALLELMPSYSWAIPISPMTVHWWWDKASSGCETLLFLADGKCLKSHKLLWHHLQLVCTASNKCSGHWECFYLFWSKVLHISSKPIAAQILPSYFWF